MKVLSSSRDGRDGEKAELAAARVKGKREEKGVRQRSEGDVVAAQTGRARACQLNTHCTGKSIDFARGAVAKLRSENVTDGFCVVLRRLYRFGGRGKISSQSGR